MAGVFGLRKVYIQQASNAQGDDALELNIPGLNYGYIAGGYRPPNPGMLSSIERMDFGTETFSSPGNLVRQGSAYQCVSSENYGYFMGGQNPDGSSPSSDVSRLDFSNETSVDLTDIPSPAGGARSIGAGGMQTPAYGYISGGAGTLCTITRIDFSTESITLNSAGSMSIKGQEAGTVYSPSYGYIGARFEQPPGPTGFRSVVDRFDFSVETCASLGNLSRTMSAYWAYQSQATGKGYFGGGYLLGTGADCKIDRIDFATDTYTQATTSFPRANQANQDNGIGTDGAGYLCGGFSGASRVSTVDKLDFITETGSTNSGTLATGTRQEGGGVSAIRSQVFRFAPGNNVWKESPNYGYFGSGEDASSNALSTISKIDFSSETLSNPTATTTTSPIFMMGTQNSNYGYFVNGYDGTNNSCTVNRFDFSNETLINSTSKTNRATRAAGSVENKNYAYFGGGYGPGDLSTIDRMDFSTEVTSLPGTFLSRARGGLCGSNNENYGYFAGGTNAPLPPLQSCTIDRIDFSTETVANPPVSLSDEKRFIGGLESQSYGYFAGGSAPAPGPDPGCRSNIDRMDFSSETLERLSAQLSVKRDMPGATANFSYGYIGGGRIFPPTTVRTSTIDRLDFISDTISTPSSTLPSARSAAQGISGGIATRRVGKATYGYFAGGQSSSIVDRLDFTTETVAKNSIIGRLSIARAEIAGAVSNNSYGYFGGGYVPTPSVLSTIDRFDFSNDTASIIPNRMTQQRQRLTAVSANNYGYITGGIDPSIPSNVCTIDRLDFATETIAAPGTYQLTQARRNLAGTSSNSYGYIGGGGPVDVCTIDRLDFAVETVVSPGTYQLTQARRLLAATSSNSYGYFGGGQGTVCTIDRLDFSTEVVSANPNQLTQNRESLSATSSDSYAYFSGGTGGSTLDRLDFLSGTVSLPSQNLTTTVSHRAAVSNG